MRSSGIDIELLLVVCCCCWISRFSSCYHLKRALRTNRLHHKVQTCPSSVAVFRQTDLGSTGLNFRNQTASMRFEALLVLAGSWLACPFLFPAGGASSSSSSSSSATSACALSWRSCAGRRPARRLPGMQYCHIQRSCVIASSWR